MIFTNSLKCGVVITLTPRLIIVYQTHQPCQEPTILYLSYMSNLSYMSYNTVMNFYEDKETAEQFIEFLESPNGAIQKQILLETLEPHLPKDTNSKILDAACGTGWLAGELSKTYPSIQAFDSSSTLIKHAQKEFPHVNFQVLDAGRELPYQDNLFDLIILSMASHDLEDQPKSFANLFRIVQPEGTLLVTLANPYYSFPVGVWKRGLLRALLGKKPLLRLRPYNFFRNLHDRAFKWNSRLTSRFYPLSEQINNLLGAGFTLTHMQDLVSRTDSPTFNATYQLHRFPTILLLKLKKPLE